MSTAAGHWKVRSLTHDEWDAAVALDSQAFGFTWPPELISAQRNVVEGARLIGAYDGTTLVGIAAAYAFEIGVPGATLAAAGVTWVAVLPTHRRRGVLTALMTAQLHDVHAEGREPIAILWASEPQIYGRYGYGLSSRLVSLKVPRDSRALLPSAPADPTLRTRLVDLDDWKVVAPVYDAVAATRPGLPSRDESWWHSAVRDLPDLRGGRSALRAVVVEDADTVRGYALYSTQQHFDENFGSGLVKVREVLATDAAAQAALYRYLFDLDLMGRTDLWNAPVDDPLLHWLVNPRRAKLELGDGLYTRLVDAAGALAARRYAAPVDVVLDLHDTRCPWNAGCWRLIGGPENATCEPTDDPADLAMDISDLGAVYLGGTTLAELAIAGRVVEHRRGALGAASAAFSHSPAPWCPAIF